jgi:ribose 5-phosphate isomerase A
MSPVEPYASLRWPVDIVEFDVKRAMARSAADRVRTELARTVGGSPRVGLGSGSTSLLTLLALAEERDRLPAGVVLVATSYEMEWYAAAAGFTVVPLGNAPVEVAFDGADQVDPVGALVKGRGGAVHRERAVLAAAGVELIVADASKRVASLGGCRLPLVLDPAGIYATVEAIEGLSAGTVGLRTGAGKDGPVLGESGGVLADLEVPSGSAITAGLDARLRSVPGVQDTGFFAPSRKREFIEG